MYYDGRTPTFYTRHPDAIKHVMIKDFDHFTDAIFVDPEVADLGVNDMGLFNKKGEEWRALKAKIVPAFSLKNMKNITPTVNQYVTSKVIL